MAVTKRVRFEVLRRDNNTCRYCHATDTPLTIDHVLPVALGGTDDPSNLCAACKDCNAGKTSSSPDASTVEQVSGDAERWAAAMKLASERLAANKAAVDEQLKPWFNEWWVWAGPGWTYKLPEDADKVLRNYLAAGMPLDVLRHAARIALRASNIDQRFRYFQGVTNNMLAELQRDATAILADQETTDELRTDERGNRWWYNRGLLDCCMVTGTGVSEHPDHYQMLALSRVVDRVPDDWFPFYSGRLEQV